MTMYYNTIYEDFHLKLSNKLSYSVTLGNDVYGNITRINNVLNGIEDEIYKAKEQLVEMNNQFEIAKEQVKIPFSKEEELKEKTKKLNSLNKKLIAKNIENEIQEEQKKNIVKENRCYAR